MPSQSNSNPAAPGPKLSPDVFISYSSADKKTADAICTSLEHAGLSCWIAPRNIAPGRDYGEAIIDGISQSRLMVLVLSQTANASQQVKREVERSVNKSIPIIPFRIEDVPMSKALEYYLSTAHWLDAYTPPLSKHLKYLESTARSIIEGTEPDPDLQPQDVPKPWQRWFVSAGIVLLAIGIIGTIIWLKSGSGSSRQANVDNLNTVAATTAQRTLVYSLTVQKLDGDSASDEESTGQEIFGNGWKFRVSITPAQSGSLYMLNEFKTSGLAVNYNALFPTPQNNNGVAQLAADRKWQTGWYHFPLKTKGLETEKFWIIWSAQPLPELDAIFKDAANHGLIISDSKQVGAVQGVLALYKSSRPEMETDAANKRTTLKGRGNILVSLLELKHEKK